MHNYRVKPLVGVLADNKHLDGHNRSLVMDKYLDALSVQAQVTPFIIPACSDRQDIMVLLGFMGGLLLPGSPTNIDPVHYGEQTASVQNPTDDPTRDRARDWSAMVLIPEVLKRRIPLLGICRGMQEMNVAMGGSLYAEIHNEKDRTDHREDKNAPFSVQYGPAHDVAICPGGILAAIWSAPDCQVNSLHGQAVKDLGEGLVVEAVAGDNVIEAIRHEDPDTFALGVQWHPEAMCDDMPLNQVIFHAFGKACRAYRR